MQILKPFWGAGPQRHSPYFSGTLPMLFIATLVWAPSAQAQEFIGPASAVTGDILEIQGQCIRLFGVDAPELEQTCRDAAGAAYPCGERATVELENIIRNRSVHCERVSTDNAGRPVAMCSVGKMDIGARMVDYGYAVSYRLVSNKYGPHELRAQARKQGLWAGTFEMPRDYSRRMRQANIPVTSPDICTTQRKITIEETP